MTKERHFVALGPNQGSSPEGTTGFYTSATTLDFGVNVQGKTCGVFGESEVGADRVPPYPASDLGTFTGVCGYGLTFGVVGIGHQIAGVWGEVPAKSGGMGIIGVGRDSATGILGASYDRHNTREKLPPTNGVGVQGMSSCSEGYGVVGKSINRFDASTTPRPYTEKENGLGVQEADGTGTGVLGTSGSGSGVRGIGVSGTGVHGTSATGRGGVFESESSAQVGLTPQKRQSPPKQGNAGDLLVIMVKTLVPTDHPLHLSAELWFCLQSSTATRDATWGRVDFNKIQT